MMVNVSRIADQREQSADLEPVIDHYYHFAAELFLGAWRTYTSLGKKFTASGETDLPAPARAWFIRATEVTW